MKNILLFLITVFSVTAQAQVTIQVSDEESKENIEFASILLPDYKKSFVADEQGKFIIDTNKYKLPLKVLIEQFGFESKEIILQNNTKVYNIYLNPMSELLREIIIPPKNAKNKERIYGRTNEGSGNLKGAFRNYNEDNKNSGLEFGMILNTNNKFKKIEIKGENQQNYLMTNVGFAISNSIVGCDSTFDDWTKFPMNYPFYTTVNSCE